MSIQFILGTAKDDHFAAMVAHTQAILSADPKAQVFLLVPNHVKFEAEVALLQGLRTTGGPTAQMRVQTLSFTRLAWYYLKNSPVYQQPRLDRATNTMLVARLLKEHQDELHLYAAEAGKPGFIAQLADQLIELKNGRIDGPTLAAALDQLETAGDEAAPNRRPVTPNRGKLSELVTILDAYDAQIGTYVTEAGLLQNLAATLSQELPEQEARGQHTHFVLAEFNDLAAAELAIVTALMQHATSTTVALTMDAEAATTMPEPPALFLPAAKLYHRLVGIARDLHVRIAPDLMAPPRPLSATMAAVADFWQADTALDDAVLPTVDGLTLAKASDPYTELRQVAIQINQAVHAGAHYRDFLVIARHLAPYQNLIGPIFADYDIPVFTDLEHPMQAHPLVALLESLFAIRAHYYQYHDVMRLLKTELLVPKDMPVAAFRAAVDVTDNHLLRTGGHGKRWLTDTPWRYFSARGENEEPDTDPAKSAQINAIRLAVQAWLPPLFTKLDAAATGAQAARILYTWLVDVGVPQRLTDWRDAAMARGDVGASTAGEQAWETFVHLLEAYATVMADAPFDFSQFADLLQAGFAGATYTQIPSTLDQVVVSETALVRLPKFKHVFVIGATSAVMPDTPGDSAVLTAADRAALAPALPDGVFLPEVGPATALGDPFINYMGTLAGSQTLTMSYPVYGEGENNPSPYLTQMAARLARGQIATWDAVKIATPVAAVAGTPRSLLSDYVRIARLSADDKRPVAPAWQRVLQAIQTTPWAPLANRLENAVHATNHVGELPPALAKALYNDPHDATVALDVSVSRLETYYRNPFEYFLKYGLRLNPRPEFELTPADTGTLYHTVMDAVLRALTETGQSLTTVSVAELAAQVATVIDAQTATPRFEILTSGARMGYQRTLIETMLTQVLASIRAQQQRTLFHPTQTEINFGRLDGETGIDALVLPIPGDRQVRVRGRVDRLDAALVDDTTYFLVIDYKSSTHDFVPAQAYYGTALQLLTYIDAIQADGIAHGHPVVPAGGQYFRLHRPRLAYAPAQDAEMAQLKDYKMKGILVFPEEQTAATGLAGALDSTLADGGGNSLVVPLGLTKSGGFNRTSTRALTATELALFVAHNRAKIANGAAAILDGVIDLAPIQFGDESTVITNSDYQAIMTFDPATGFDRYHHVQKLDLATILQRLSAPTNA